MYGKLLKNSPLGMNSTLSKAARGPKNTVAQRNLDRDTEVAAGVFQTTNKQSTPVENLPEARMRLSKGSMEGHRSEKGAYIEMDGQGYSGSSKSLPSKEVPPREKPTNPYAISEVGKLKAPRISDTRRKTNDKLGHEDASLLF